MRPTIGIFLRTEENKSYLKNELLDAVIFSGGFPVALYASELITDDIIEKCDGFIFPGGDDFTDYDIKLIDKLSKLDKPVLGICLGMQTIGFWRGGRLEYIEKENHLSDCLYVHDILINKNSKLYKIIGEDRINVNSRHRYAIKDTNLFVSAISNDNLIEAIELLDHKFFIGVQWHPESTIKIDINSQKLFSYFIKCCGGI